MNIGSMTALLESNREIEFNYKGKDYWLGNEIIDGKKYYCFACGVESEVDVPNAAELWNLNISNEKLGDVLCRMANKGLVNID